MANYQPSTREERLARLRQMQEAQSKIKTGYDSGVLELKPNTTTTVRILPPVGNMDQAFYHVPVGYHMIGDTVVRCAQFTTSEEIKCPVCEVEMVLRRGGANDKERAKLIRLNKKYWFNVIVRDMDVKGGEAFNTAEGPLIYKAGVTVFDRTRSFVADPEYGLIDDPEVGVDIKIERTGENIETRYNVNTRRATGPLLALPSGAPDWEGIQKILEAAKDLCPVEMPENPEDDAEFIAQLGWDPVVRVYGFERTVAQFGVCLDTLHQLDEIIASNINRNGQGNREGDDGRHAMPQRGNTAGQTRQQGSGGDASAIKDRIAKLRSGK